MFSVVCCQKNLNVYLCLQVESEHQTGGGIKGKDRKSSRIVQKRLKWQTGMTGQKKSVSWAAKRSGKGSDIWDSGTRGHTAPAWGRLRWTPRHCCSCRTISLGMRRFWKHQRRWAPPWPMKMQKNDSFCFCSEWKVTRNFSRTIKTSATKASNFLQTLHSLMS